MSFIDIQNDFKRRGGDGNMNFIKKTWEFFSGKKTLIGAGIYFLVDVIGLAQVNFGFQWFTASQLLQIKEVATYITGVGFLHKGFKTDTVQKALK